MRKIKVVMVTVAFVMN
ncbi:Protein of unknown function [Bacillus wiedmannii]|uniref:Uncharacterized protein n=1 Tax=Bacillus wiedmannii TaxID=1890302 RepID=A0A1C4EN92_9BACI|nr:Protein of unknown function [Bacillus wiedmannii]